MADGGTSFGGSWRTPGCLFFSVFLSGSLWHVVTSKDIQPTCLTDYDAEVVCRWEVDASTDCAKEFLLNITAINSANKKSKSWVCSPETERGLDVTSNCTCIIQSEVLVKFKYHFSLEANGKEIWKIHVDPDDIVKPRPLVNLFVKRRKDWYIFTWEDDYKAGNILHNNSEADYEVAYWPEDHRDEVRTHVATDFEYKIFAGHLKPETLYVARVRYKIDLWGGLWSDWSFPYKWKSGKKPPQASVYY